MKGFSLIELVVFILIMGIISVGVLMPFVQVVQSSHTVGEQLVAMELAQGRMDIIIGNNGADPCSPGPGPAVCSSLTGYTVSSTLTSATTYTDVTVTVSGLADATLQTRIYNTNPS